MNMKLAHLTLKTQIKVKDQHFYCCSTSNNQSRVFKDNGCPHPLKRVIQLCDTNQVHNSDERCNGHVRYCCNLASVVLCKLSQLNLSETTGLNGTKLFWRTNRRIKKYINGLRIDSAISELRISSAHRFIFNFFLIFFTVRLKSNDILGFNLSELGMIPWNP